MSRPCLAYDMVRLLLATRLPTPRGIDRIDLGLARGLFATWGGDCVGVLPTPWGLRSFTREHVLRALACFDALWPDEASPPPGGAPIRTMGVPPRFGGDAVAAMAKLLARSGLALGSPVRRLPRGSILVNAGHDSLTQGWLLSWLRRRPDVKLVALVHDLIPTLHPDLVSAGATRSHARLLDHVATYAAAAVVPSRSVACDLRQALRGRSRADLPIHALGLPVQDVFLSRPGEVEAQTGSGYFVVCGALDPRKNHDLLLDVWGHLASRHGPRTPALIVAGAAGWGAEPLVARLDAASVTQPVRWAPHLATGEIRRLMAGATALLMPSRAEGFGLPIAEALALGTPVIASDIAAHHEAGGASALYAGCDDRQAWLTAIEALAFDPARRESARAMAGTFEATTWPAFIQRVERVLGTVSAQAELP